jgi:hypothetical protein
MDGWNCRPPFRLEGRNENEIPTKSLGSGLKMGTGNGKVTTVRATSGTGQGSGDSPMIAWCFISSMLFDCHQAAADHAANLRKPRDHIAFGFILHRHNQPLLQGLSSHPPPEWLFNGTIP